jgi:hypothetical protein
MFFFFVPICTERICTVRLTSDQLPHPHWANIGCPKQQLRSVVLALGGFRRIHSQFLCHLSKPQSFGSSASSTAVMFLARDLQRKRKPSTKGEQEQEHEHEGISVMSKVLLKKKNKILNSIHSENFCENFCQTPPLFFVWHNFLDIKITF